MFRSTPTMGRVIYTVLIRMRSERVHVYRLEADKGRVGYGDGHREWRFTDEKVYQFAFYKGNFPAFRRGSI